MRNILSFVLLPLIVVMVMMSVHVDLLAHNHDITGNIVSAKCDCGFKTSMALGGGKMNFETVCIFPFYCKDCSSLIELNTFNEKYFCEKCNSENVMCYDNDSLRAHKSDISVFGWNLDRKSYVLKDDFYLCPQCKEFKLKFKSIGFFD
ncbi:MAG: hypothetical protein NTY74_06465 [Ignavibacteriae bacterium]|nr:hypothetical protein [Ignavibacteriota bacterium]